MFVSFSSCDKYNDVVDSQNEAACACDGVGKGLELANGSSTPEAESEEPGRFRKPSTLAGLSGILKFAYRDKPAWLEDLS